MNVVVGVNERGRLVGQSHQNARLTNQEIDLLLEMHDKGYGYRRLAKIFNVSKSAARKYCKGEMRCQLATRFKEVHVTE